MAPMSNVYDRAKSNTSDMPASTVADMRLGERMEWAGRQRLGDRWAAELSTLTGIDRRTISAIKTGRSDNPRPETFLAIADALGIEPKWLATGSGRTWKQSALTDEEQQWLEVRENLTHEQRTMLRRFLDALGGNGHSGNTGASG